MARDLTSGMKTAVESAFQYIAFFVELETASGFVRVWTGIGDYSWNGHTWKGIGDLGSISAMGETTDTNAMGTVLTLSGITSAMVTAAITDLIQGKPATVWLAEFAYSGSPATLNIVADPYRSFAGRVDAIDIDEGGSTCSISISVESLMIDLQVSTERRWTSQDQKIDWPDDTGFDSVEQLQEFNSNWGAADQPIPQKQS